MTAKIKSGINAVINSDSNIISEIFKNFVIINSIYKFPINVANHLKKSYKNYIID